MSLSMEETERLRKAWGGKICTHPHITKEKGPMGQHSDYACEECGEVSWSRESLAKQGEENKAKLALQNE